ncbi:MAG TPA: HAMP domain-containing sensor histidine kinase [Gaiellales bacterium]|jgi:signal transduction histidine kinase|nr:HAMP domain-containing sensor histidine kinase [Gaiellales bacterium]
MPARLLTPLATLLAVALLHNVAGGDRIRYELLLLLPIVWLALQGTVGELAVAIVGLAAGLSVLNLSGGQTAAEWWDELVFVAVASAVGLTVQHLIEQVRRQASDVAAITRAVQDVAAAPDTMAAREVVCRAATEILGAQLALMLEPDGESALVVSAAEGSDVAIGTSVPLAGAGQAVLEALDHGEQRFLPDEGGSLCAAAIGASTALIAPVQLRGVPAGALVLGWKRPLRRVTGRMAEVISLFAVESARSLERGDLIAQVQAHATDLEAVVEVARRLPRSTDAQAARDAVCAGVLEVCDGMLAVLMEPDGEGNLVSTAVAGAEIAPMRVSMDDSDSATVEVYRTLQPFFVPDLGGHPHVSQRLVHATGAVSALWQPVVGDGAPVGVLVVAWQRTLPQLSDRAAAVVGLFAAEAAVALERADLLARLETLNRMLAVQVEALRVSDQLKSDFVSSVSHELRTPLASILGYLDVLLEGELGEMAPEQTEFVRIVDENARRLLSLINDLLTLSGIEGGRMLLRPEPIDLRPLVERYVLDLEVAAAEKGLDLSVLLPADEFVVQVDPERIGQVVTNLVANAVKFSERGGDVRVELRREAGQAVLSVADTGIGIPAADSDRLFQRFFRARNATDAAIPGTGLGLAICKGIVDAHGGDIVVESQAGEGTTVRVYLPMTTETH